MESAMQSVDIDFSASVGEPDIPKNVKLPKKRVTELAPSSLGSTDKRDRYVMAALAMRRSNRGFRYINLVVPDEEYVRRIGSIPTFSFRQRPDLAPIELAAPIMWGKGVLERLKEVDLVKSIPMIVSLAAIEGAGFYAVIDDASYNLGQMNAKTYATAQFDKEEKLLAAIWYDSGNHMIVPGLNGFDNTYVPGTIFDPARLVSFAHIQLQHYLYSYLMDLFLNNEGASKWVKVIEEILVWMDRDFVTTVVNSILEGFLSFWGDKVDIPTMVRVEVAVQDLLPYWAPSIWALDVQIPYVDKPVRRPPRQGARPMPKKTDNGPVVRKGKERVHVGHENADFLMDIIDKERRAESKKPKQPKPKVVKPRRVNQDRDVEVNELGKAAFQDHFANWLYQKPGQENPPKVMLKFPAWPKVIGRSGMVEAIKEVMESYTDRQVGDTAKLITFMELMYAPLKGHEREGLVTRWSPPRIDPGMDELINDLSKRYYV
jgi:hypothetical protein